MGERDPRLLSAGMERSILLPFFPDKSVFNVPRTFERHRAWWCRSPMRKMQPAPRNKRAAMQECYARRLVMST